MSSVEPGSLVLITGINGHIASAIAMRLLQKGYKVRGTVRELKRAQFIQKEFSKYAGNLHIVEVPVITAPNAFTEALKGTSLLCQRHISMLIRIIGVDAVIHTASPVTFDAKVPAEQASISYQTLQQ